MARLHLIVLHLTVFNHTLLSLTLKPHQSINMSSYFDAIKPESDIDSQLTGIDSLDSQLTVAKGLQRSAPPEISTVLFLPPHLPRIRQLAFALNEQLTWTADDYAAYWPFLDNIWMHNHTERVTKKKHKNRIGIVGFGKTMLTYRLKVRDDELNECDELIRAL